MKAYHVCTYGPSEIILSKGKHIYDREIENQTIHIYDLSKSHGAQSCKHGKRSKYMEHNHINIDRGISCGIEP